MTDLVVIGERILLIVLVVLLILSNLFIPVTVTGGSVKRVCRIERLQCTLYLDAHREMYMAKCFATQIPSKNTFIPLVGLFSMLLFSGFFSH